MHIDACFKKVINAIVIVFEFEFLFVKVLCLNLLEVLFALTFW